MQAGTYVEDNYAHEPEILKHIHEANAGFSLSKNQKLWIDMGVFASHIGFESAVSSDNFTLTRSLLAENSPYYLSGAKITYEPNHNFDFALIVCNGWQRIKRLHGNTLPSFGSQLNYFFNEKLKFSWNTFIGTDTPDSTRRMRMFSNKHLTVNLNDKITFVSEFDYGLQQTSKHSKSFNIWYGLLLMNKYKLTQKCILALRGEYYNDNNSVIVSSINNFRASGLSINFDYLITSKAVFRVEVRRLFSDKALFVKQNGFSKSNMFVVSSIAIKL